MPFGVILALVAYGVYSCSDATVKSLGNGLSVFEISFFTSFISLLPAMLTKPGGEHWRHLFRMQHPWLLQIRGIAGVTSSLLVIYAFLTVPLAEVYSLVFLTPIFVTVLSVVLMGERVSPQRWLLLGATFLGVLLVVRPGFRELHWGHLAAVASAFFSSINTIILRHVSGRETRTRLVGLLVLYALVINGALMLPGFSAPTGREWLTLAVIGILGGAGQILFISATRHAEASQIAPAQYSQIVWAITLGAVFYDEVPDGVALIGLAVVIVAGVLNVLSDKARIAAVRRFSVVVPRRRRRSTAMPDAAQSRPMTPAPLPQAVVMQRK